MSLFCKFPATVRLFAFLIPGCSAALPGAGAATSEPSSLSDLEIAFHFTNTRSLPSQWNVHPRWSVTPSLRTSDHDSNAFVVASSPDGQFQGFLNHPEGLDSRSEAFDRYEEMLAAISGKWTMDIDPGSEHHRTYFFSVDATDLPESRFAHFGFSLPPDGGSEAADSFAAEWSEPADGTWNSLEFSLYHLDPYELEASGELGETGTDWTPDDGLKPGPKRLTVIYRTDEEGIPELTVEQPHDGSAPAPFDWHARNHTSLSRSSRDFVILSGFSDWARRHFSPQERADPNLSGLLASPLNDGLTNLEKYAFGMGAFEFDASRLPTLEVASPDGPDNPAHLIMTFRIVPDDPKLNFQAAASSDLETWRFDEEAVQTQVTDNDDGTLTVTVRGASEPDALRSFLQLLLTYDE